MRRSVWIACLVLAIVLSPAMLSAGEKTATMEVAKVQTISYPPDSKVDLDFRAWSEQSKAAGKATIDTKGGPAQITATFKKLDPPSSHGPEYLVYVLWAVTPEGRVTNLGPVSLEGSNGTIVATTRFQSFALGVTAEPYFAVSVPSNAVVLVNTVPDMKNIQAAPIEVKAELLQRGHYKDAGLKPVEIAPKTPIELYEARQAVQIARWQKADQYAAETFQKAVQALDKAEKSQADKKGKAETVIMASREAVQFAEDARGIAAQREEEVRLTAERQASMDREAAAMAQAQSEATQRQVAEQQRAASETARAQAIAGQQQAMNQAAGARASSQRLRADLLTQLDRILATVDTDRGLVTTMAGVTFATDSAALKPAARESLAKLAGVLALNPGLKLDIEGYTDNVGGDEHNRSLSEKRAAAVRDYLVEQGIPAASISATGMGKESPVAPNDSPDGRAKNRRVEIVVSGEAIGTKIGG
jgi:outer membrane protein OmpA-like peptidoglycan-associated protein